MATLSIKDKHKKEYEDIEFVSKYYKIIKNNLNELGYDDTSNKALEICDNNLGIVTKDYLLASVDFSAIQPHSSVDKKVENLQDKEIIKVSEIANAIGVSSKKVNDTLVGAGLIERTDNGGTYVTPKGISHGGHNKTVYGSRKTYVVWEPTILQSLVEILGN